MANPRLAWSNLVDQSGVVLTPSSEAATLPVENIINQLRTKVWQTGTTLTTEFVTFDFGAAVTISAVILLDHDLQSGDTGLKLMGNTADSWGAPAFTQNLTYRAGPISEFFAEQSFRYWRVEFIKDAAAETRQIGRVFLGTYYNQSSLSDLSIMPVDLSKSTRSIGGQQFTDIRPRYDNITLDFELISKTEYVVSDTDAPG